MWRSCWRSVASWLIMLPSTGGCSGSLRCWLMRHAPAGTPPGDRWFVDETYVKVAGRWVYLYRAVDQLGQVIDVLVSQNRDLAATRRFFTRALQHGSDPTEVTTDRAPAYPRVIEELIPAACHITEQYANNPVEAVRREVARNEWITRIGGRY